MIWPQAGVPVVPGMDHGARDADEARAFVRDCGYPVLLKAVAGGGGKGMRRVDRDVTLTTITGTEPRKPAKFHRGVQSPTTDRRTLAALGLTLGALLVTD